MAIEMKFLCSKDSDDYLIVDSIPERVVVEGLHNGKIIYFLLDEATAIKFAKTVRTHINKIKEVQNG